jgi:hypothetical protein
LENLPDARALLRLGRAMVDPELSTLREVLSAWAQVIGVGWKHRCTLQEVIERAGTHGHSGVPTWPDLDAAVQGTARGPRPPDAKSLGTWAKQQKGRIVAGLRLINSPNPKGGSQWWVERNERIPGTHARQADQGRLLLPKGLAA